MRLYCSASIQWRNLITLEHFTTDGPGISMLAAQIWRAVKIIVKDKCVNNQFMDVKMLEEEFSNVAVVEGQVD